MEVLTFKTKYRVIDGVIGGIIGGIALGLTAMVFSLIMGKGMLYPLILSGYVFQPYVSDPVMSGNIIVKAIAVHFVISMLGGIVFTMAANTFLNGKNHWFWGMVIAGLMWLLAIFGGIQTVDATMAAHMNQLGFFLGYMAYGASMGAYVGWAHQGPKPYR